MRKNKVKNILQWNINFEVYDIYVYRVSWNYVKVLCSILFLMLTYNHKEKQAGPEMDQAQMFPLNKNKEQIPLEDRWPDVSRFNQRIHYLWFKKKILLKKLLTKIKFPKILGTKSSVKMGSITAEILLICTNVARTYVNMTVGICSRCFQEPIFKVSSKSGQ